MIANPWNPSEPLLSPLLLGLTRFLVGGHAYWVGAKPTPAQRIYFANHTSNLDTLVLWAALPPLLRGRTHPVAAADYWGKSPLRRHAAVDVLGAVLIDRKREHEGDPLEPLFPVLDAGESLIIFPEGGRGAERLPGPFKSGLYNLGRRYPDAELIPTYLENISRAFPRGALFPAPIGCSVRFGAPVRVRSNEDRAAFLQRAYEALCALAAPKDDPVELEAHERAIAKAREKAEKAQEKARLKAEAEAARALAKDAAKQAAKESAGKLAPGEAAADDAAADSPRTTPGQDVLARAFADQAARDAAMGAPSTPPSPGDAAEERTS